MTDSLKDRLTADMKAAMKAGESGKLALSVIRMVRAAVKNAEIDRGHELDESEVMDIIARELKQRRESIAEFQRGDRPDLAAKTESEARILQAYLPAPLTPDEIRAIVRAVVAEVGATGPRDLGKVMPPVMARTRGRADGKEVSAIVRQLLQQ